MNLEQFVKWQSVTMYGARMRNDDKVGELNDMMVNIVDGNKLINRNAVRKLFMDSQP